MDRHLNIFHHYDQNGSIPIENNVSRGLAILFQEEPALLMMFISEIQKRTQNVMQPTEEYEVDFQRRCDQFKGLYHSVIGVTLTAEELVSEYQTGSNEIGDEYRISDISIMYDDTLILIEVKRTGEDCRNQVFEQINHYKNSHNTEMNSITSDIISFTWRDIMAIIEKFVSMNRGKVSRLVADYYMEVAYKFPTWCPIASLNKLDVNERARIYQRIERIKEKYVEKYSGGDNLIYSRTAIPLDWHVATECNIDLDMSFVDETCTPSPHIVIGVWPSDTCGQYWELKRQIEKNKDLISFLNQRYQTIGCSNKNVKVRIYPYLKFCNWNKGVMWLYANSNEKTNNISELLAFGDKICGQWNRNDDKGKAWDNFVGIVEDSNLFSSERIEEFKESFTDCFLNTNRSRFSVSLGFEVFAYLKYNEAQIIDSDEEPIQMVKFLNEVISGLKNSICG